MVSKEQPYSPPATDESNNTTRPMLTWIEVLVIALIILFITAILLPAVHTAREHQRYKYSNHLRMLALGVLSYESLCKRFPPAYTQDTQGNKLHCWRTFILPYVEQGPAYDAIEFTAPWDSAQNTRARQLLEQPNCYLCPLPKQARPGFSVFHASVGKSAFFPPFRGRLVKEIEGFGDQKLMIVESHHRHGVPIMKPEDLTTSQLCSDGYLWAPRYYPRAFRVAMADGSLREIAVSTDSRVFRTMITIGDDAGSSK